MNSTVAQSTTMTMMTNNSFPLATDPPDPKGADEYHTVLLVINSLVLVSGTVSLSLMMHILKSSSTSITSIAVLNLIFAHFIFLMTVPFRIYYYGTSHWSLGLGWCRLISSMIHVHMYMSFIFYVIILVTRLLPFYRNSEQLAPFRSIHALLVSAAVWLTILVIGPLIIYFSYGKNREKNTANVTECFNFGRNIHDESGGIVVNYIMSTLIIVVAVVLTALQANVLRVLYKKHRQGCVSQQDFGAQLKSLCFAIIMVVCFVPYHLFRLYYLQHIELQHVNEVFLSLTTFNCLDMLTFLGRRTCYMCFLRRAV